MKSRLQKVEMLIQVVNEVVKVAMACSEDQSLQSLPLVFAEWAV